jgi:nicotinate-nucleotide pyrophosphorylase (carboxylating)
VNLDYLSEIAINGFISSSLREDIGDGDYSSLASVPEEAQQKARLYIKDDGILAGVGLAEKIFFKVDPKLQIKIYIKDGKLVKKGDVALDVEGSARSILKAERLVLNCMQRMSGIATKTFNMNKLIEGTQAKLLDTRKTTPNFRVMEKWAVLIGGGHNHRFNLCDMIMLKDNHIDYAGGIKAAIESTLAFKKEKNLDIKVEVETRNIDEVKEVLSVGGIERIMLDNFSPEEIIEALKIIDTKIYETEASGGITEENIRSYAETGVKYISCGALTHSYKSLDLSLKAYK